MEKFEYVLAVVGLGLPYAKLVRAESRLLRAIDAFTGMYGVMANQQKFMSDFNQLLAQTAREAPSSSSHLDSMHEAFQSARSGNQAMLANKPRQALESYQRALEKAQQAHTSIITQTALTTKIAEAQFAQGDINGALTTYQHVYDKYQQNDQYQKLGLTRFLQANLQKSMGDLYVQKGDYQAAIDAYQQALELYQATGADSLQISETTRSLGEAWRHTGQVDRAVEFYRQAFAEASNVRDTSIERANLFRQLGDNFLPVSDRSQATVCYERAITDYRALGDSQADALAERLQSLQKSVG